MNHPTDRAWYALRRTLPPWRFDENLAELVARLPGYRVDELIVKIDTEEFSHGHPSVEWALACEPKLLRVKEELSRIGIVYSLNPWITVGHTDRGRDDRDRVPGLRTVVGEDGTACRHCACPLSQGWRERVEELWTIYARTEPAVMWVEDDIRTFNHSPVRFGCFCEEHMRRFGERVGTEVSREELVGAMLAPGEPHRWRTVFLALQGEIMVETARWIGDLVRRTSPRTAIGLMSSGPRTHALEGRDWTRFAEALAGGSTLYSRPPMGNYSEGSLRGFYYSHDSIKLTRAVLPAGVVEQTEVENVPFTRFSKSAAATFVEMAISFAYGSHGVTLNLYDHAGTPMEEEPRFGALLGERKPFLNAIRAAFGDEARMRGVRIAFHPDSSRTKRLAPGADYGELAGDGYPMMLALEAAGIATGYEAAAVVASAGQTLRSYTDARIEDLLHGGLLLDATAAGVLVERGFGELVGLESAGRPVGREEFDFVISAERFANADFGGRAHDYLTATLPSLSGDARFARMRPAAGARIVSEWVDPDVQPVMPAMIAYENRHGGRVVVHGLDYASAVGTSYHHPLRRTQLQHVVRYLAKGAPDLVFTSDGAFALAWRTDTPGHTIVGAFNLNLDAWERQEFALEWDREVPRVRRLATDGTWIADEGIRTDVANGVLRVSRVGPVRYDEPLVLRLE